MHILAIDTSCDETAAAVTHKDRVLSNVMYSQIFLHKEWGGVVPDIARRAHQEHIDEVISKALKTARMKINDIDAIAVTYGPGLAIALGVGIDKAKELAMTHNKPLIPVNHMEGHLYSTFATNSQGSPHKHILFPLLALLVSGSHTELILMKEHGTYEVIGEKRDDAAGEALDKAARIILNEHVYPGGALIEELARTGNDMYFNLPIPMKQSKDLDFSYSGVKTALLYYTQSLSDKERIAHMNDLAATFQRVVFTSIVQKLDMALKAYKVSCLLVGGGVGANALLRKMVRRTVAHHNIPVYFPYSKKLYGDNAAMIGVAGYYKAISHGTYQSDFPIERRARSHLGELHADFK